MMIDMHIHRSPLALFDIYHGEAEALMNYQYTDGDDVIRTRRQGQPLERTFDDLETGIAEMETHGVTTGMSFLWARHQRIERLLSAE